MDCKNIRKSSSSHRAWKYEVFLSFRGEDTRNNFTDHLFAALKRKGISVFKDDKELRKGKAISSELLTAIEESRISIVIFSRTYAASTWCLEELAKIAQCVETHAQNALPVFYDVNPSEVRKQSGNYKEFFVNHEERFKENLDNVQRWRLALSKVSGLSGWDMQNKPEAKEIEKIVMEVINKLGHRFSSLADDLVGIQSRAETLENLLNKGSKDDVQVVGICGMPGIGKTTLAAVVYDRISYQFDVCSFLFDVTRAFKDHGLVHLQEQLLCETLNEKNLKIWDSYKGTNLISTRLSHLKALIVLDNVDEPRQLENLVGKRDWFGFGSRIIIITRDEHILKEYGVDDIYKVKQLNDAEVTHLLCRKAFKRDDPRQDFKELTCRAVEYVNGLPLAAKVLGSFLYERDVLEWEDALNRFEENPKKEIMDVLQTSFDGLEELEKEIFLDIACFFNGMSCDRVKRILHCCGFNPEIGISVLIDKSLLIIVGEKLYMHDLLQQLGRCLVRRKALNEPGKWSRLWCYKDLYQVMIENKETEYVEAIVLDLKDEPDTSLRAEALANISHLRLLIFHNVKLSGSLKRLSNQLKYLEWHDYPFTCLPSDFHPSTLVELNMPNSYIKQLWGNKKPLPKLESLDLRDSKGLIKVTDLELFPNLQRLNLEGCTSLRQVGESIIRRSVWSRLYFFFPRHRGTAGFSLASLPSLLSLRCLNLSFCDLSKIPDSLGLLHHLESLHLCGNTFKTVPSAINKLPKLEFLKLDDCKNLQSLPELPFTSGSSGVSIEEPSNIWIAKFPSFFHLTMFNCPHLTEIDRGSSWAFEWLITRVAQIVPRKELWLRNRCEAFVPGSEIPRWFSNQSLGPSIRIPIPPKVLEEDRNFLCLTFSAVFVAHHLDFGKPILAWGDGSWIHCDVYRLSSGTYTCGTRKYFLSGSAPTVGLDHLWLFFITQEQAGLTGNGSVRFTASPGLEVKKCGVHWLFKEDIPKLALLCRKLYNCGSGMQLQIDEEEMANKMLSDTSEEEIMSDSVLQGKSQG